MMDMLNGMNDIDDMDDITITSKKNSVQALLLLSYISTDHALRAACLMFQYLAPCALESCNVNFVKCIGALVNGA